jgi:hypothetical protein
MKVTVKHQVKDRMTKFEFSTCRMEEWRFLSSSGVTNNITKFVGRLL